MFDAQEPLDTNFQPTLMILRNVYSGALSAENLRSSIIPNGFIVPKNLPIYIFGRFYRNEIESEEFASEQNDRTIFLVPSTSPK